MIEDELKQIEEESKALQETLPKVKNYTENGNMTESEVTNTNETYEELTERLLKVASSIQESAKSLGQEEIDLSPRINKIQLLKDECQKQSNDCVNDENKNISKENEENSSQEILDCKELKHIAVGKEDQSARMNNSQLDLNDFQESIENKAETISQEILDSKELKHIAVGKEDKSDRMNNGQLDLNDFQESIKNKAETDISSMN